MTIELTDEEVHRIGFVGACYLDELDREINKMRKQGKDMTLAIEQRNKIEELIYTIFIPKSWSGPRPSYWSKIESEPLTDNPFTNK